MMLPTTFTYDGFRGVDFRVNKRTIEVQTECCDFTGAIFIGVNLAGVSFRNSIISQEQLESADLSTIKADLFLILDQNPEEAPYILEALEQGRIDGGAYFGECACLMGTIAKLKSRDRPTIHRVTAVLDTLGASTSRPAERWFLAILEGDTPETNQVSAITAGWIKEWLSR